MLTLDRRLRTRPHERAALEQSGLLVFILAPGWAREAYWPKVTGIIRWLPRIIEAAEAFRPPGLLGVPYRGRPDRIRAFS